MPRSVNILIRDGGGKTLLQFRDSAASSAPLRWSFWGGRIEESDESDRHAAARELAEELGVHAALEDLAALAERRGSDGQEAVLVLLRRPLHWGDFVVKEGAGAAFFWRRDLLGLPLAKSVAWYLERRSELFADRPS